MPPLTPELPDRLATRPIDPHRKLPIPFVSVRPGDEPEEERADFTAIQAEPVIEAVTHRLCGICGHPLEYWMAFLGGPRAARTRTYTDPAMHRECAEAALTLCPHIAVKRHQRAPEHRLQGDPIVPAGFVDDKPDTWVLGITRSYEYTVSGAALIILPAPFKQTWTYGYDDNGNLTDLTGQQGSHA